EVTGVVGEAEGVTSPVAGILSLEPDLVFLDIQMPGMDGFAVLRAIAGKHVPLVIFVTAYDEHATRAVEVQADDDGTAIGALEVGAFDYVLKPVVEKRFRESVRRAVDRLAASGADTIRKQ